MDPFGLSRRSFVVSAISSTAVVGTSDPKPVQSPLRPTHSAQLQRVPATVPFHFDRTAFQAVLERPFVHRQLAVPMSYATATVVMSRFQNSLAAYADPNGFAAGPNSLHCIAVLYGGHSYNMVLDDAMYAKYPIGLMNDEEMRPNDLSARGYWKGLRKNPMGEFLHPLLDQGVSFFVCNHSLSALAVEIARRTAPKDLAVTRDQVVAIHDELAEHFLPGATAGAGWCRRSQRGPRSSLYVPTLMKIPGRRIGYRRHDSRHRAEVITTSGVDRRAVRRGGR